MTHRRRPEPEHRPTWRRLTGYRAGFAILLLALALMLQSDGIRPP